MLLWVGFYGNRMTVKLNLMTHNPQKINNIINKMALLYAFCLPLSRAGLVFTSASLVILWIVEGGFKEKIAILKQNTFVISTLLLTSYMLLSFLWSDAINGEGLYHFKRLWYYTVIFVFITSLRQELIPRMMGVFLSAMLISEILSYGIFFELWTLRHGSPADPTPFMNHLSYSLFLCATAALLVVKFLLEKESLRLKIIYGVFFISSTTNLFITDGRSGQVAFIFVIAALIIFNVKNKIKGLFMSILLLTTVFFIADSFSPSFHHRAMTGFSELSKFIEQGQYRGSWGARLEFWDVGLSAAKQEPILGVGIGDITANLKEGKANGQAIKHVPSGGYHSDLLETIVAGGLLGAILFMSIFFFLWKAKIKDPLVNNMRVIVTVIFICGLISDNFLRAQFTIVLFSFFVGIIFAQQRHEQTAVIQAKI